MIWFLSHIRHNFADAFFPRLSEWTAAVILLALGVMLHLNPDRMTTGNVQAYALMLSIAPQPVWAFAMMTFGSFRCSILLVNGAWRRSPWARALTALLSVFFWNQITLSFAPTFGFAFILACGVLGMDLVNIFRAMLDARRVDDEIAARGKAADGK